MTASVIAILLLFAFGASFTQRVTGFGFGIYIMTVLPFLMPSYAEATALSGLLALVTVVTSAFQLYKYLDWRKLWIILLVFIVISFFSVLAVSQIDSHLLKRVLGVVLILVSIYFFFFSGKVHLPPSAPVQLAMGAVSGLMGGFFAMQGPPAVIYFLSCTETKEEYLALASMYFAIGNTMMTVFRFANGFITPVVCKAWLVAVPAVIAGLWVGTKVSRRMPVGILRKVVYAFMAVAGVIAIVFA